MHATSEDTLLGTEGVELTWSSQVLCFSPQSNWSGKQAEEHHWQRNSCLYIEADAPIDNCR